MAYTYNDPVIFLEYAVDIAKACKEEGIDSVAVTAGYITPQAREEFFQNMDAANVDLKGFTEQFYKRLCAGQLSPVLETLKYLKYETKVWFEITNLIIPGHNDSEQELEEMTQWIVENLGPAVPLHFTAFHPDWKMRNILRTPPSTLIRARNIAMKNGIRYVYVGNVSDKSAASTYCHQCGQILIGRDWYVLSDWNLSEEGRCNNCGTRCLGKFAEYPGTWGARRQTVRLAPYSDLS